jgi:hypothetical protein
VRVHGDSLDFAVSAVKDDVGGFPCHAWQLQQFLHGFGNFAVEFLYEHFGGVFEVSGFVVVEARRPDVLLQFSEVDVGVVFGFGVFFEEFFGDFVYLFVGCLRGKHGRYEQLQRIGMMQGDFGV